DRALDGGELPAVVDPRLQRRVGLDVRVAGLAQQFGAPVRIGFAEGAAAGLFGLEFLERGLERGAVAEFFAVLRVIELVAGGEDRLELVILLLRKGVVFVIVAAGAA